jgi:hypothetical protein
LALVLAIYFNSKAVHKFVAEVDSLVAEMVNHLDYKHLLAHILLESISMK